DGLLSTSPSSFISQVFLAASALYRLKLPQISLLNKSDLLSRKDRERIERWCQDIESIEDDLESEAWGVERVLSRNILAAVKDFLDISSIIITSSKTMEGLDKVYMELQRIYKGGEDFELPDHLREL
ncbi:MAG: GTPase, partial [Thermoprotei archaeon]